MMFSNRYKRKIEVQQERIEYLEKKLEEAVEDCIVMQRLLEKKTREFAKTDCAKKLIERKLSQRYEDRVKDEVHKLIKKAVNAVLRAPEVQNIRYVSIEGFIALINSSLENFDYFGMIDNGEILHYNPDSTIYRDISILPVKYIELKGKRKYKG